MCELTNQIQQEQNKFANDFHNVSDCHFTSLRKLKQTHYFKIIDMLFFCKADESRIKPFGQ